MATSLDRVTECTDTFQHMIRFAAPLGISPMILRATCRELCANSTPLFSTELSLRNHSATYYEDLCKELLTTIPRDTHRTFFVEGVELYVADWSNF